ncbi:MAG: carbon-nitrogen hydrolase family protein [Patescibacteria group bacterium]|nr:carbon-nitrogen hydrolase family protein [Patescibacteria group bacterium]MCL5095215.1 carbon-nitrogen hydrolase family protein [Patescibacteria group bacterium]
MIVKIAQLIVTRKIAHNLNKILKIIYGSEKNEWIVFPEGMLSGYYPEDDNYPGQLNFKEIKEGILKIEAVVKEKNCLCLFGTAYKFTNDWYNATVIVSKSGTKYYFKNNLATLDRKHFKQGNKLEVYEENGVRFGIQMCRELVFPEQWKYLKKQDAQVVFHLNNAIKPGDSLKSHLVISRAFENQYFVCSVNNAEVPQTQPSLVVSPLGEVIYQSEPGKEVVKKVELDLSWVKNDYLQQERIDLVEVISRH